MEIALLPQKKVSPHPGGDKYPQPHHKNVDKSLAREGVCAPAGPAFLPHTKQKVSNIVGLTALRLAFFMGYE